MVIIEDFSYMHTIGQHKRLSLAREEGDPTKWCTGSDFRGAGSGLFRHKLSPGCTKLKCGIICHLPCCCLNVRRMAADFSRVGGVLWSWGRCSHCGLCDFMWEQKYKLKNLWNPKCSTSIFILLFYNCLVFFRNPASTLFFFDTKQT